MSFLNLKKKLFISSLDVKMRNVSLQQRQDRSFRFTKDHK